MTRSIIAYMGFKNRRVCCKRYENGIKVLFRYDHVNIVHLHYLIFVLLSDIEMALSARQPGDMGKVEIMHVPSTWARQLVVAAGRE